MARAMVKPTIVRAPASRNPRAHAPSFTPVVITSSSNKTRKLSTRPPSRMAKAPPAASERSSLRSLCFSGRGLARVKRTGRCASFKSLANEELEKSLFHLFLAGDAVFCPGNGFEPLLLHFFLAAGAESVFVVANTLQRFVDHVQERATRTGLPEKELFCVGVCRLVGQIDSRVVIGLTTFLLGARDGLHQFVAAGEQPLLVVLQTLLIHVLPPPDGSRGPPKNPVV